VAEMSRKLLHKTLRAYTIFSVIVLLISAPLFYFLADKLFIDDADEALLLRKKEFLTNNLPNLVVRDVPVWNKFNRDIKIEGASLKSDSLFYRFYIDSLANENEPYRVLLSPVMIENRSYTLMARVNLVESEDMIMSIAVLFSVILGTLLVGLYFITRRLSSKLWMPFYSTLRQVEQFELDKNTNPKFTSNDTEEFIRLNQSVGRLLERNLLIYKNQKEFIENAAHELNTPLASFQAELDALVQQLPFTKEIGDRLTKLNNSSARLNRINKNLLLLSKIENNQFPVMEQVSVNDMLTKQTEFLTEQAKEKGVSVYVKEVETLTVKANATLLEIAVSNLLLNALRHNRPHGEILIALNRNKLTVSNLGHETALNKERIFQRFSNPGENGGSGLGLAIVKKITDLHGWQLEYAFHDKTHTFHIAF
jgi:signal transduction histidine kinase